MDLLIDHIQEIYPRKAESYKSVLHRVNKVKRYIHSLFKENSKQAVSKVSSKNSKIVVVTHSAVIKLWTGKWDKPLDEYCKL